MKRAACRLSYANVAATLALVLSMTGGALAARHYLLTSTSQISPKVLKALRGAAGAPGSSGPPGPRGAAGPPGPEGHAGRDGREGKDAEIPGVVWTPLALANRWAPSEIGSSPPEFTKDALGFVHLKGAIDGETRTSNAFAQLPPGFRPTTEDVWLRAAAANGQGDPHLVNIEVKEGGEMDVENGPGANDVFVSLEGLTFSAG